MKAWVITFCSLIIIWIFYIMVASIRGMYMIAASSTSDSPKGYEQTSHNLFNATDITLITGYINIGAFPKGGPNIIRRQSNYHKWLLAYRYIHNPMIAFFERGDQNGKTFLDIRNNLDVPTHVIWLSRDDLWSFSIKNKVGEIFKQPGYHKHFPNTVVPEYACVSLAKFEFVKTVLDEHLANTTYIAWVDAGYWRWKIPTYTKLLLPPDFEDTKVAFNMIEKRNPRLDYKRVIRENSNWIAGGFFLSTQTVMHDFVEAYMMNVKYFISLGYFAAEQQLLYSMANTVSVPVKLPDIQTYSPPGHSSCPDPWMYLGCLCYKQYELQSLH